MTNLADREKEDFSRAPKPKVHSKSKGTPADKGTGRKQQAWQQRSKGGGRVVEECDEEEENARKLQEEIERQKKMDKPHLTRLAVSTSYFYVQRGGNDTIMTGLHPTLRGSAAPQAEEFGIATPQVSHTDEGADPGIRSCLWPLLHDGQLHHRLRTGPTKQGARAAFQS